MPILGLPLTSEQKMNADIVKQKKIGTILNYREVDEEALENAIKKLMDDKKVQTDPLEVSAELKHYI